MYFIKIMQIANKSILYFILMPRLSTLWMINLPGSTVVKGVDEHEGQGTGETSGQNVHGELPILRSVLRGLKSCLDGVLEGKVQSLSGEVTENVGQVT